MTATKPGPADEVAVAWELHGAGVRAIEAVPIPDALREGVTVAVCTCNRAASLERMLRSLANEERARLEVLVVDASPDDASELAVRRLAGEWAASGVLRYVRVTGRLRGLTRQRNLALRLARTDVTVFFDDDIVLQPNCIDTMERVLRDGAGSIVGVGAYLENEHDAPSLLWRIRRALRIVPELRPGAYARSGISIPWHFLPPGRAVVGGDWLTGGAMMWPTALARRIGFHEGFEGYSNGEDVQFSLAARACGRLVVAGSARALHLQDPVNRPSATNMAYVSARNAYHIHRTQLRDRTTRDALYFHYAFVADTVVRFVALLRPGVRLERWRFLRGRVRFLRELFTGRLR